MRTGAAAFLPLTLAVLEEVRADRCRTHALQVAAHRAEQLANDTWQGLLGDCDRRRRTEFTTGLRRLSLEVGGFVGDEWANGHCTGHRDRIARYHWWLEEAVADGSGDEFAEAFARYDDALARTVLSGASADPAAGAEPADGAEPTDGADPSGTSDLPDPTDGEDAAGAAGAQRPQRRPAAVAVDRSGTMAGWARQARAATTRATHRATSPLRWATSRHAMSSSRWSRH